MAAAELVADVGLAGDARQQLVQRLVLCAQGDAAVDSGVEVELQAGIAGQTSMIGIDSGLGVNGPLHHNV